jgi:hypothetical protein
MGAVFTGTFYSPGPAVSPFVSLNPCAANARELMELAEKLMVGGGRIELPTPAL